VGIWGERWEKEEESGWGTYINIPKNRAPIFVDAVQIIQPAMETVMRHMM
jgi:hypothetical protein